jgi:RNA polymerase sigma-70 factor (ECF subfamily)
MKAMERSLASRNETDALNRGESDAFSTLYEQHAKAAYGLALRLTADPALAEDVFQEAMLRVWRSTTSLRPGNIRGWVLCIVGRECIRLMKRRKFDRLRTARMAPHEADDSHQNIADKASVLSSLRIALAELAEPDRRLVELYFSQGLSQRQIGEALSIPQQTICYRLRQVLDEVRNRLAGAGLSSSYQLS